MQMSPLFLVLRSLRSRKQRMGMLNLLDSGLFIDLSNLVSQDLCKTIQISRGACCRTCVTPWHQLLVASLRSFWMQVLCCFKAWQVPQKFGCVPTSLNCPGSSGPHRKPAGSPGKKKKRLEAGQRLSTALGLRVPIENQRGPRESKKSAWKRAPEP